MCYVVMPYFRWLAGLRTHDFLEAGQITSNHVSDNFPYPVDGVQNFFIQDFYSAYMKLERRQDNLAHPKARV